MALNIGFFFGGRSAEHEISIISALQAINAAKCEKYNPIPVYIAKTGEMFTGDALMDVENFKNIPALLSKCEQVFPARVGNEVLLCRIKQKKFGKTPTERLDAAFPVVHGTNCEDGTVAGLFELLNLPYVGPDVLSSAIGMDKIVMKKLLFAAGLPVVEGVDFFSREYIENENTVLEKIEGALTYPVIVKPANLGSSIGITLAQDRDTLKDAIELAIGFSPRVLVERAVQNLREINCSVLGDYRNAKASLCEEPIGNDEILSFADKYLPGSGGVKGMSGQKRRLPAEITSEQEQTIKDYAVSTFKALFCAGVARVDFLLDNKSGEIFVNEINTIPGSLSFYLWEPTGVAFPDLIEKLIDLAYARHRERERLTVAFENNVLAMQGGKAGKA